MDPPSNRLPVLAAEIMRAHAEGRQAAQMTIEEAIKAGEALLEAKEHLKHGEWLSWLRENCPGISERTVQRYMRVAKHKNEIETIKRHMSDLSLNAALDGLPEYPKVLAAGLEYEEALRACVNLADAMLKEGAEDDISGLLDAFRQEGIYGFDEWQVPKLLEVGRLKRDGKDCSKAIDEFVESHLGIERRA